MSRGRGLALILSMAAGIATAGSAGCVRAQAPVHTQVLPVQTTPVQVVPAQVSPRVVRPQVVAPRQVTPRVPLRPQQPPPPPPAPPMVMRSAPPPENFLWPSGIIPMCFEDADPENDWARDQIRAAAATWEAAADVHFDFASTCGGSSGGQELDDGRVPIRIVRDPEMFASSSHLGISLKDGGEITLNAEYLVTNRLCGPRGTIGELRCFYADALHELGHALGFSHDHVSANAPNCLARTTTPEAIDAGETYYDPISIMNYCNANRFYGFLSAADVCSVQAAYGVIDGDRPRRSDCYDLVNATYPAH